MTKTKTARKPKVKPSTPPKAEDAPKIECAFVDPADPSRDRPGGLYGEKRRTFLILVQSYKDKELNHQAVFSELKSAESYVEMRERVEGLKCFMWAIEHNPAIIGKWTVRITVKGHERINTGEETE